MDLGINLKIPRASSLQIEWNFPQVCLNVLTNLHNTLDPDRGENTVDGQEAIVILHMLYLHIQ